MKNREPVVLSLFTGAGGLDLGFQAAGFRVACCIELEEWACQTLRANHPNIPVLGPPLHSGDVREITAELIYETTSLKPGEIDVMIGGPPCQPFSQAASQRFLREDKRYKRQGFNDDVKGLLLFEYLRLILEIQPKVFLIENVPGLKSVDGGQQLQMVLDQLQEHGYNISPLETVNSANYGVPQFRERLIIWGSKTVSKPTLPLPSHTSEGNLIAKPFVTVAEALTGMPQDLPNHVTREHSPSSIARYRTLEVGKREKLGRVDRLDPDQPSKTVIAGGMKGGGRSHLHPFIARTLSVRECARLQTFSDDYIFQGSIARQFTQVGNAVPPLLAEKIARHIKQMQFNERIDDSFVHGSYLHRKENVNTLIKQLLKESLEQCSEWIYFTHAPKNVEIISPLSIASLV